MNATQRACGEYRNLFDDGKRCQLALWLFEDRTLKDTLNKHFGAYGNDPFRASEVHHIAGRGSTPERNWYCCLIFVSDAAHDLVHDHAWPVECEIAAWRAKLSCHREYLELLEVGMTRPITDETRLHWHPEAVGRALKTQNTLAARIHYLLAKKKLSATFRNYAHDILTELGEA